MRMTPLKTPTSVAKQKLTGRTPIKTPLKTPDRATRSRTNQVAQTPQTVRRKLRNRKYRHIKKSMRSRKMLTLASYFSEIVKVTEQVLDGSESEAESDDSGSGESSSEDEEVNRKLRELKAKAAKNQGFDISVNTEDYFLAQGAAVHTSDRTLNRLKNPRLSQEAVDSLLENVDDCHAKEKQLLMKDYQQKFPMWTFLLR